MAAALTVAILAGGRSRRMGCDKALLPVGGVPMLQRVIDAAQSLSNQRILVSNHSERHASFGWPLLADAFPDAGPLGGLATALRHATTSHLLLLACDMPFLTPGLLHHLIEQAGSHQAVVPDSDDGLQPLCAVYTCSIAPLVEASIAAGQLGVRKFVAQLDTHIIPPCEWQLFAGETHPFANLNTPEEYHQENEKSPRRERREPGAARRYEGPR